MIKLNEKTIPGIILQFISHRKPVPVFALQDAVASHFTAAKKEIIKQGVLRVGRYSVGNTFANPTRHFELQSNNLALVLMKLFPWLKEQFNMHC